MLYYLIAVIAIVLIILERYKSEKFKKIHEQLGCDFQYIPIFGHLHVFFGREGRIRNYIKMARYCYNNKYGMTSFWIANQLFVGVAEPLEAKFLLKRLVQKGTIGKLSADALGNSSIFITGKEWQRRRKVMAGILSPKVTKNFIDVIARHSVDLCNKLQSETLKGELSIWKYVYSFSLDVIIESTFDINLGVKDQLNHPFITALDQSFQNLVKRISQPWQHIDYIYKWTQNYKMQMKYKMIMSDFIKELITNKRKKMEQEKEIDGQNDSRESLLELMIQFAGGNDGYNDDELMEETLLLIEAGTDTSATSIGFICVLLSLYEDVQEKGYEEVRSFFANSNKALEFKDLERFKYIDAIVRETIRLYPSGPLVTRECDQDIQMPSGITLTKGVTVIFNVIGLNRHPSYWGADPENFRPERFLEGAPSHPAAFMTFSNGPQNCAGQQLALTTMKILIVHILRSFRIKPAECFENNKRIKLCADVVLRPINHFKIKLEPRNE